MGGGGRLCIMGGRGVDFTMGGRTPLRTMQTQPSSLIRAGLIRCISESMSQNLIHNTCMVCKTQGVRIVNNN